MGDAGAASISLAQNTITNTVMAEIEDASVTSGGDVSVNATESATIFAFAVAAAFAGGEDLKSAMQNAGLVGAPTVWFAEKA